MSVVDSDQALLATLQKPSPAETVQGVKIVNQMLNERNLFQGTDGPSIIGGGGDIKKVSVGVGIDPSEVHLNYRSRSMEANSKLGGGIID